MIRANDFIKYRGRFALRWGWSKLEAGHTGDVPNPPLGSLERQEHMTDRKLKVPISGPPDDSNSDRKPNGNETVGGTSKPHYHHVRRRHRLSTWKMSPASSPFTWR